MNTHVPDQLRLLALIHRTGSLAGAAETLGVTPAAATQRLAKAERDWGMSLVRRGPRGAVLTRAGLVLAPYGDSIDRQALGALAALDDYRGRASRRLRIGAFQAAALHLLPPALTALRHRKPEADLSVVDISSDRAMHAVAAGELDLAVLASWDSPPPDEPGLTVHHLLRDPLVAVLPDDHPLAAARPRPLRLAQLRAETWVLIRAGHAARDQFDRAAGSAGFAPHVRFETESYDVAQALVGTGIGVALVSRLALTGAPGTTHRLLGAPTLHRDIHVAVRTDTSFTPLAAELLTLLADVSRDINDSWSREKSVVPERDQVPAAPARRSRRR
jgi:DNA-binding transcriptional LysR family regulator